VHVPDASDVFRWNRAEGAVVGLGFAYRASGVVSIKSHAGWSFGRDEPTVGVEITGGEGHPGSGIALGVNVRRDLGLFVGVPDLLNTLAGAADRDWTDPWFSSGGELFHTLRSPRASTRLSVALERQESGESSIGPEHAGDFRIVRTIDEGWVGTARVASELALRPTLIATLEARGSRRTPLHGGATTNDASLIGSLAWERGGQGSATRVTARLDGGIALGAVLRQHLFLLGGVGTLLGQPYRQQVGDRFWLARLEASRSLFSPWVTLRALAGVGAAQLSDSDAPLEFDWQAAGRAGMRGSAGAGVGLLWDVLHIDVGHGVKGGEWELVFSVDRRFRGWL
jgi:hypothetical protein